MVDAPGNLSAVEKREFEEKVMEHLDSLYNLAWQMTQNRQDAEDLVQNTALAAFRFFYRFKTGSNFKAWIMTILRNTFINEYRKAKKQPVMIDLETVENFIPAPGTEHISREEFGESLKEALDGLPEDARTILSLFYLEDFSYAEIAGIMECPLGTVMSRLYSARQILKKRASGISVEKATEL